MCSAVSTLIFQVTCVEQRDAERAPPSVVALDTVPAFKSVRAFGTSSIRVKGDIQNSVRVPSESFRVHVRGMALRIDLPGIQQKEGPE